VRSSTSKTLIYSAAGFPIGQRTRICELETFPLFFPHSRLVTLETHVHSRSLHDFRQVVHTRPHTHSHIHTLLVSLKMVQFRNNIIFAMAAAVSVHCATINTPASITECIPARLSEYTAEFELKCKARPAAYEKHRGACAIRRVLCSNNTRTHRIPVVFL
jgi:hypothetical protein